jgi:uncharacterized protein (DUF1697 family)
MPARAYAAFLRGVMPTNARMPDLVRAFTAAGFTEVRTLLSSGNLVFRAATGGEAALERQAEAALVETLGRTFPTYVRSIAALEKLLAGEPYAPFGLAPDAKRVVTFLRVAPRAKPDLPVERSGAGLYALRGRELYSAYRPGDPQGPVFMTLIEKTFGQDVTTRTWDTVAKVAAAGRGLGAPSAAPTARTPRR